MRIEKVASALLLVFLASCGEASAQEASSACSQSAPAISTSVEESPIKYDMDLTSYQLPKSNYRELMTLGIFKPFVRVEAHARMSGVRYSASSCEKITGLSVVVDFSPVIYVAKESQAFSCTYARVLRHERTHYAIEHRAFEDLAANLPNMAARYFSDSPVDVDGRIDLNAFLRERSSEMNREIGDLIERDSAPYHAQLDNLTNYAKETAECSGSENAALQAMIKDDSY